MKKISNNELSEMAELFANRWKRSDDEFMYLRRAYRAGFLKCLRILNETPVERSELINFFDYIIKRYSSDERFHRETVVDDYLKLINAAKRIES